MADGSINFMNKDAVLAALGFSEKKVNKAALDLAHLARAKWVQLAKGSLHTSLREYQNAIQVIKLSEDGSEATTDLVGQFPNMVEWGNPAPVDMRTWLLRYVREGGKINQGKNGKYRVIPMRRSMEGTGMAIPLAGKAYDKTIGEKASNALRMAVLEELKSGHPSVQMVFKNGKAQTVRRGDQIQAMDGGPLLKAQHKVGLYAGMSRFISQDGKHNQYKIFRTISENVGKGQSWMYPVTKGYHFLDEVQRYIAVEAQNMFASRVE